MSISAYKERPARPKPRHDEPRRGKPLYPGLTDGDKKRKGRENRKKRRDAERPRPARPGEPGYAPRHPRKVPSGGVEPSPKRASRVRFPNPRKIPLRRLVRLFDLADIADELVFPSPSGPPGLPGNWKWCQGPVTPSLPPAGATWDNEAPHYSYGSCAQPVPLWAQASGPGTPIPQVFQGATGHVYWVRDYTFTATNLTRSVIQGVMQRTSGRFQFPIPSTPVISLGVNPNAVRYGYADPLPETAIEPVPRAIYDIITGNPGMTGRSVIEPAGGRGGRVRAHRFAPPPRRRDREGKALSTAGRIGAALFRLLDALSEGAEIVDAIYDALPEDVKARWNRPKRPGDNFGQYGLEGADWKLQALYYNWHKVDVEQAVKNMWKNALSDRIIGAYQRALPRNTGNAVEGGEKAFAKWLDRFLTDELGL